MKETHFSKNPNDRRSIEVLILSDYTECPKFIEIFLQIRIFLMTRSELNKSQDHENYSTDSS